MCFAHTLAAGVGDDVPALDVTLLSQGLSLRVRSVLQHLQAFPGQTRAIAGKIEGSWGSFPRNVFTPGKSRISIPELFN